jgi:hypothetical protein
MSTGTDVDVVPIEANQLGEAQARLGRNQQGMCDRGDRATSSDRVQRG